jgi:LuxR family transcriptional regulator, maltose regulon positive regulatory protein
VAELVARGWTNSEVASALSLRPKTVEWTLTNVYRKLELRSRTELALRVATAEADPFVRSAHPRPGAAPRR